MKLPIDSRFLATALITFFVLIVAVVAVTAVAGVPAATVVAAAIGTISIKLFDKLDYTPSFTFEPGVPTISAPWIYGVVTGIMVLWGCTILPDAFQAGVERVAGPGYCSPAYLAAVVPLDWGSFVLAGWVLGKLFRERALTVTSAGAFVFVVVAILEPSDPARVATVMSCVGLEPDSDALRSLTAGMVMGIAGRGYLAVVIARVASKRAPLLEPTSPAAAA